MKNLMMKLAGVKTEEDFYKKYPTEESFMAKHGKAFKKAQGGTVVPPDYSMMDDVYYTIYNEGNNGRPEETFPNSYDRHANIPGNYTYVTQPGAKSFPGVITNEAINAQRNSGTPGLVAQAQTDRAYQYLQSMGVGNNQGLPGGSFTPGLDLNSLNQQVTQVSDSPPNYDNGKGKSGGLDTSGLNASMLINPGLAVGKAIMKYKQQQKEIKGFKQMEQLTDLMSQNSRKPDTKERKYVDPSSMVQPVGSFINSMGTGTDILAKSGKRVKKAQDGLKQASSMMDTIYQYANYDPSRDMEAGQILGQGIGEAAGQAAGILIGMPEAGQAMGQAAGGQLRILGDLLDRSNEKKAKYASRIKSNVGNMMFNAGGMDISSFAENGTKVGMGGDLQIYNGTATPVSYNEFMPGGGETYKLNGQSHDGPDGGVLTSFGGNLVLGEGQEHVTKLGQNMHFTGKTVINKEAEKLMNIPGSAGKTFNTLNKLLSKKEAKYNKMKTKVVSELADYSIDESDPGFASRKLMAKAADENLQAIAGDKLNMLAMQQAYNDTADELGLDASELAKGKIKMAKRGAVVPLAQNGKKQQTKDWVTANEALWHAYLNKHQLASNQLPFKQFMAKYHMNGVVAAQSPEYKKWYKDTYGESTHYTALGNVRKKEQEQERQKQQKIEEEKKRQAAKNQEQERQKQQKIEEEKKRQAAKNQLISADRILYDSYVAEFGYLPYEEFLRIKGSDKFKNWLKSKKTDSSAFISDEELEALKRGEISAEDIQKRQMEIEEEMERTKERSMKPHVPQWVKDAATSGSAPDDGGLVPIDDTGAPSNTKKTQGTGTRPASSTTKAPTAPVTEEPVEAAPATPYVLDLPDEQEKVQPTLSTVNDVEEDDGSYSEQAPERPDWFNIGIDTLNSALPYLRPSDTEQLDPRQIMGELYALATDKPDSVPAQLFHPQLATPQDISLQDMLNENRAGYRASERLIGGNPAALAILNAQRYTADQKALAEQFRQNQAEKTRVYSGNIDAMNNSQLQNLQLLDNQMVRQEQAKSTTKETIQNALNSIGSKYLQNQLENRKLATYENLYNYRYGKDFKADNYNGLQIFDTGAGGDTLEFDESVEPLFSKVGEEDKVVGARKKKRANGGLVKAMKGL